jgi:uncharacterized membrane protein
MSTLERYGVAPEQAWLGGLVAGVVALVGAAAAFTEQVYYGFVWRYFWGPVFADSIGAECAVYVKESQSVVVDPAAGCARTSANFVAEPGYTLVSEVGYMIVLLFMLGGVYLLLERIDLEPYRQFFFALVPFVLFGGALRVVEDAVDRGLRQGFGAAVGYPEITLVISPLIYFTVFAIALAALLLCKYLSYRGVTDTYHYPLAAVGTAVLTVTLGYLVFLSATTGYVGSHPDVFVVTLGLASLIAGVTYLALERFAPGINDGTKYMGLVVLWAHAVDGVANVIASDWTPVFGLAAYGSKHPIDRILSGITRSIQGPELTALVGDSWMFLVVKIAVPVAILAIFEREFIRDSPRYAILLLTAIVAVGLGPGTRDMIRVALGI